LILSYIQIITTVVLNKYLYASLWFYLHTRNSDYNIKSNLTRTLNFKYLYLLTVKIKNNKI